MRPILFHAGPLAVHGYGVMLALAIALAGYVLQRRAGRGDAASALTLVALVGGFAGARLYFLFEDAGQSGSFGPSPGPASPGTAASWVEPAVCC